MRWLISEIMRSSCRCVRAHWLCFLRPKWACALFRNGILLTFITWKLSEPICVHGRNCNKNEFISLCMWVNTFDTAFVFFSHHCVSHDVVVVHCEVLHITISKVKVRFAVPLSQRKMVTWKGHVPRRHTLHDNNAWHGRTAGETKLIFT